MSEARAIPEAAEDYAAEARAEAELDTLEWSPLVGRGAGPIPWRASPDLELRLCSGQVEWRRLARAERQAQEAQS